jgi:hypothetical protein
MHLPRFPLLHLRPKHSSIIIYNVRVWQPQQLWQGSGPLSIGPLHYISC